MGIAYALGTNGFHKQNDYRRISRISYIETNATVIYIFYTIAHLNRPNWTIYQWNGNVTMRI
jgi:hypothetical protein